MAYDEKTAERLRQALASSAGLAEQPKMGGLTFMLNDKFCIRVFENDLMCRIDPDRYEEALEKKGCREMIYKGKSLKGWVFVGPEGFKNKKDFDYWVQLCLDFNQKAKASKPRSKKQ